MKKIKGNTYVFEGYTNVGIYITGNGAIMIDTGSSQKAAKDILKNLRERNLKILAIVNTHSHADHIQGNHLVQEETGCQIYASKIEAAMISNPTIEGLYLYSAYPTKILRRQFFKPRPSDARDINEHSSELPLKVITLPGHSLEHIGFLTPDNVLFCGDAYFSKDILKKYIYPYHMYVRKALDALHNLKNIRASYYVPSHGNVTDDPFEDIEYNMDLIGEITTRILKMLIRPMTRDEVTASFIQNYDIKINEGLYYLTFSFVSSILQYLEAEKMAINYISTDRKSIWSSLK